MTHWLVWGSSALVSRVLHSHSNDYCNKHITNCFENYAINIYLFFIVTVGKLILNSTFYMDGKILLFGVTNAIYPYLINKAHEIAPDSVYPILITHTDPLFLVVLSPVMFGSENRLSILIPIFCMTVAKQLMVHYDNPYTRIAVDEESLQEELQQPLLRDRLLSNAHIGFSGLALTCIITKDVTLAYITTSDAGISDILFTYQAFALIFSGFYKYYNNDHIQIMYDIENGYAHNLLSFFLLFNKGLINYIYIFSLYNCYTDIPNIGYAKLFVNFYMPGLLCVKMGNGDRHCTDPHIGAYYCYFISLFGLVYFGR